MDVTLQILTDAQADLSLRWAHTGSRLFAYLIHQWIMVFNAWRYYTLRHNVIW